MSHTLDPRTGEMTTWEQLIGSLGHGSADLATP
jgi:hypothetical protein